MQSWKLLCTCILAFGCLGLIQAQDERATTDEKASSIGVIDFQSTPLKEVGEYLSETLNINVIVAEELHDFSITLKMKQVGDDNIDFSTIMDVLMIVYQEKFIYDEIGRNIYVITPQDQGEQTWESRKVTKVYSLGKAIDRKKKELYESKQDELHIYIEENDMVLESGTILEVLMAMKENREVVWNEGNDDENMPSFKGYVKRLREKFAEESEQLNDMLNTIRDAINMAVDINTNANKDQDRGVMVEFHKPTGLLFLTGKTIDIEIAEQILAELDVYSSPLKTGGRPNQKTAPNQNQPIQSYGGIR